MRYLFATLVLLTGCGTETGNAVPEDVGDDTSADDVAEFAGLSAAQLLNRASLDTRGVRPTLAELDRVDSDPAAVDAMIDAFVNDPAFGRRMKDVFAGAWRTRIDRYELPGGEDLGERPSLQAAVGEEPLNLIAFIANNDLPFTYLLESNDTFVDAELLDYWPLEAVETTDGSVVPEGLVRARYNDGRPLAGVLSMNSVFWRYPSTLENANRGRANALSQALLCQSYLDRPIDFPTDLDLTDSESIRTAIASNAACQGCHSTLDPLASYLWGYLYAEATLPEPNYSVGLERAWVEYTDTPPGFFGKGGERLVDLADHIAGDERFLSCTVRRVYSAMLGRTPELSDEGALAVHREAFLAGGLSLRALVRSILSDPGYRGEAWTPRFGGTPQPAVSKVAPVGMVASSLTELSGYTLTYDGRKASDLDLALRTLAGGSDRGDTYDVSTGAVLVQRRLAEAGAIHAVDSAAAGQNGGGRLATFLGTADLNAAPSAAQLVALVRLVRTRSMAEDAPEVTALLDVWNDVAEIEGARSAWVAVVTATLADPDHLLY